MCYLCWFSSLNIENNDILAAKCFLKLNWPLLMKQGNIYKRFCYNWAKNENVKHASTLILILILILIGLLYNGNRTSEQYKLKWLHELHIYINRDGRVFLWDFAFRVPAFLEFPSRSTFPRSCTTLFSCSPELSRSYFAFLCFCSSPISEVQLLVKLRYNGGGKA